MTSARPSVINLRHRCTPVAAPRQPSSCNGFPSGGIGNNCSCNAITRPRVVDLSPKFGFALKTSLSGIDRQVSAYLNSTFTPVLRGYESTVVGRSGLRGREPHNEPRHGHGACPRAAKARPADAVPPPMFPRPISSPETGFPAAGAEQSVPAVFI